MEKGPGRIVVRASTDRLALAALSIFWRAAIAGDPMFKWVSVPDYMLEELRRWVLAGVPPSNWATLITVRVHRLVAPNGTPFEALMPPGVRQLESQFEFVFVCGGLYMSFALPAMPGDSRRKIMALRPRANVVRIQNLHFEDVPEFQEAIFQMMAADIPPKVYKAMEGFDNIRARWKPTSTE